MKRIIKKAYDELAPEYLEMRKKGGTNNFYNGMLEMPTTLKLLGNVKGKKILDLGCGPGRYAKILTGRGTKVIGIDNSKTSIELAKKEAPKVEFLLGDIEKLPFKSNQFDIVVSAMVITHLKSWDKVLKEVKRVLKKKGIFVFSMHNPIKVVGKKKISGGKKFLVIEDYFNERPLVDFWGIGKKKYKVVHYHKTYGTVVKTLVNAGFNIIDYEDCKPLPKAKKLYPKQYESTINFPHFCAWKVNKL
ncbi:hypothetical protein CMI46_00090 [Candidatus Pacearchaeota archaeon]|nr:hypothetical protein [Candidatus Pacearchaeota archaeon]